MKKKKIFSFSEVGKIENGESKVQILRTGEFKHAAYGNFSVTEKDLEEFEKNFKENKR